MLEIVTLGIDLAKNIFAPHDIDRADKVVLQGPSGEQQRNTIANLTA